MKLTAATTIRCDVETLRRLALTPEHHVRWDVRFTDITYLPKADNAALQRFEYATRIGFGLAIRGWGETIGGAGGRSTALRFGTDDPKSLIREGAGSWTFSPSPHRDSVHFSTVYDYRVRYGWLGRHFDRLLFRPLMVAATRWSFDRLRLWVEQGITPSSSVRLWLLKVAARLLLALLCAQPSPHGLALTLWLASGYGEEAAACAALLVAACHPPRTMTGGCLQLLSALCVIGLAPRTPKARRANPKRYVE